MNDEIKGLNYSISMYVKYNFTYFYLEDRFGEVTLTNRIEKAIEKCKKLMGDNWPPTLIFYRDSERDFAIVNIDSDNEVSFQCMEAREAYSLLAILEGF